MEHFNFNSIKSSDSDNDGRLISSKTAEFNIDELIAIHGGKIVYTEDAEKDIGTFKWQFTDDFIKDIDLMWEICRKDPKKWNSEIFVLLKMCEFLHNENITD